MSPIDPINWNNTPPVDPAKMIPIVSAPSYGKVHGICLSEDITGVITHFLDRRTIPCVRRENSCGGCAASCPKRWKGYFASWCPRVSRMSLVEITYDCYRSMAVDLSPGKVHFRGLAFTLYRVGKKSNAPVRIDWGTVPVPLEEVPKAFDVKTALRRIWGILPPSL